MKRKRTSKNKKKLDLIPPILSKKIEIKSLKVPPIFSIDETKKKSAVFIQNIKKKKKKKKLGLKIIEN